MSGDTKRIEEVKRELAQMSVRAREQAEQAYRGSPTWAAQHGYANALDDVLASLEHGTSVDGERSARVYRQDQEYRQCR